MGQLLPIEPCTALITQDTATLFVIHPNICELYGRFERAISEARYCYKGTVSPASTEFSISDLQYGAFHRMWQNIILPELTSRAHHYNLEIKTVRVNGNYSIIIQPILRRAIYRTRSGVRPNNKRNDENKLNTALKTPINLQTIKPMPGSVKITKQILSRKLSRHKFLSVADIDLIVDDVFDAFEPYFSPNYYDIGHNYSNSEMANDLPEPEINSTQPFDTEQEKRLPWGQRSGDDLVLLPHQYIQKYFAQEINERRLTRSMIAKDAGLYQALRRWRRNNLDAPLGFEFVEPTEIRDREREKNYAAKYQARLDSQRLPRLG